MAKEPFKVIVNRPEWYRGKGSHNSRLARPDETMCCLGFACVQAGIPVDHILNYGDLGQVVGNYIMAPMDVPNGIKGLLVHGTGINSPEANALMEINDGFGLSDQEREAKIKEEGLKIGIAFEFVG